MGHIRGLRIGEISDYFYGRFIFSCTKTESEGDNYAVLSIILFYLFFPHTSFSLASITRIQSCFCFKAPDNLFDPTLSAVSAYDNRKTAMYDDGIATAAQPSPL